MTLGNRYESVALGIVPKSSDRSRSQLRTLIARALEAEVTAALTEQREKAFPELRAEQDKVKEVERQQAKMSSWIDECQKGLQEREAKLQQVEAGMATLLKAFDSYAAWLEGDGEVDDNGKRFDALRAALKDYRNHKEKT